jgi:hypothetical protein
MRSLSSIRIVRVVLAVAVALWMAGAGCMLGCEGMVAAASSVTTAPVHSAPIIASGEVCASVHAHDCCAKHGSKRASAFRTGSTNPQQATTAVTVDLGTSGSMMDCPLAVNATAALSKAKQDHSGSALLLTRTNGSIPFFHEQASALSPPVRLPNRGHTYLRCCVFLI